MKIHSINPATGKTGRSYEATSPEEARAIVELSDRSFQEWRRVGFKDKAALLRRAAEILRGRAAEWADLMAVEMGKPLREGKSEAEKCAWACDFYAEHAENFLASEIVQTDALKSFVAYRPLGVILAVMPWNFPFWQVFRFAAPALMAGNVGVLKHASNVPGCALAIEQILREAGFPENVFRTLVIGSKDVDALIAHPAVRAVTLTGSTPAGKAVAAKAGEMLKKTVLELGGSDPYLILEDADLEKATALCATSRLINTGQSCIAAKRFIVAKKHVTRFEDLLVLEMSRSVMGDPRDPATTLGPLARRDLRDELHQQVAASREKGARCLLGGTVPEGPGAYYPATVLADVRAGMPAYHEELFGPVASIIPVETEEEALQVANDTVFGLGAAVFTRDLERGERIATEELDAGSCFVNGFVKSDPRLPFGGVKESGYGRELSVFGIREFVNIKTVHIQTA